MSVELKFYGYLLVTLTKLLNFVKMLKNIMKIAAKQTDFLKKWRISEE